MKLNIIILAAGKGTRMKCKEKVYSKVAFPILNEPIVSYVLRAVKKVKPNKIITIVGFGAEITTKLVKKDSEIVYQREQKGTGHAVMQAKKYITNKDDEYTIVLCGDAPLIRSETIKKLVNFHIKNKNAQTILSAKLDNPFGYGRIVRDKSGRLVKIVEQTDADPKEKLINEVNSGVVIFTNKYLLKSLSKLTNDNKKKEYYLTQLISIFMKDKLKVDAMVMDDPHEMDGINDRRQLYIASLRLQKRINDYHIASGVKIINKRTTKIGPKVTIGKGTTINPGASIFGNSKIGEKVVIGANVLVIDSSIKTNSKIKANSCIKNNKVCR